MATKEHSKRTFSLAVAACLVESAPQFDAKELVNANLQTVSDSYDSNATPRSAAASILKSSHGKFLGMSDDGFATYFYTH